MGWRWANSTIVEFLMIFPHKPLFQATMGDKSVETLSSKIFVLMSKLAIIFL